MPYKDPTSPPAIASVKRRGLKHDRKRYAKRLLGGYFRRANRRHYLRNKVAALARWAKRNALKHAATTGDQNKVRAVYARAAELRQWFDVVVDHIIPLAKGGAHSSENLQIIYKHENAKKGVKLDYAPSVVFW